MSSENKIIDKSRGCPIEFTNEEGTTREWNKTTNGVDSYRKYVLHRESAQEALVSDLPEAR